MSPMQNGDSFVLLRDQTIERPYGWIFFYGSKLWHETKDTKYLIAGNGPLLVEKHSGAISQLGTAHGVLGQIRKYEDENKIWDLVVLDGSNLTNDSGLDLRNRFGFSFQDSIKTRKESGYIFDSGAEVRLKEIKIELDQFEIKSIIKISEKYESENHEEL